MSQHLTPEERSLFAELGTTLPWPIRAYLWTLQPALTTRGRLVVGGGAAAIVGCVIAVAVDAVVSHLT